MGFLGFSGFGILLSAPAFSGLNLAFWIFREFWVLWDLPFLSAEFAVRRYKTEIWWN